MAASILVPIFAYYGLDWEDMTSWQAIWEIGVQNSVVVMSTLTGVFNAITDPTTKGIGDSTLAMG